jgi:hypothetical protein
MLTFNNFYLYRVINESSENDISDIKAWRLEVERLAKESKPFTYNSRGGGFDFQDKIHAEKLIKHMTSKSGIAFSKLYRFHQLEFKIHLLKKEINMAPAEKKENAEQLLDFSVYEINSLFDWIREWMLGVLESRILYQSKDNVKKVFDFITHNYGITDDNYDLDKFYSKDKGSEMWGTPWVSILSSYKKLQNAQTLKDKIIAVTLSLNAWHDNGGIFGVSYKAVESHIKGARDERSEVSRDDVLKAAKGVTWAFAPLSLVQFDKLDKINARDVEREIQKDLYG